MPTARTDGATVRAVRHVYEDVHHLGTVEATSTGWRAYTPRGLRLGTYDTEGGAEGAVRAHRAARRAAH